MRKFKQFTAILLTSIILASAAFGAGKVSEKRQALVTTALSLRGTKYVYGGTKPETGLDCSGFVGYAVLHSVGKQLPRTAAAIYTAAKPISGAEREPGDLMFFQNSLGKVNHVGIYCGVYHGKITKFQGKRVFVSAVSDGPETGVVLASIDSPYWKSHFHSYGRILPPTNKK